jgi:hypothetical protein
MIENQAEIEKVLQDDCINQSSTAISSTELPRLNKASSEEISHQIKKLPNIELKKQVFQSILFPSKASANPYKFTSAAQQPIGYNKTTVTPADEEEIVDEVEMTFGWDQR